MASLPDFLADGAVIFQRTAKVGAEYVRADAGSGSKAQRADKRSADKPLAPVTLSAALGTVVLLREGRPNVPSGADGGPWGAASFGDVLSQPDSAGAANRTSPAAAPEMRVSKAWDRALGRAPRASTGLRTAADTPLTECTATLICEFTSCDSAKRAECESRKALRLLNRAQARALLRYHTAAGWDETRAEPRISEVPERLRCGIGIASLNHFAFRSRESEKTQLTRRVFLSLSPRLLSQVCRVPFSSRGRG